MKKKSTKDSADDRNVVHGFELFEAVTEKTIPGYEKIPDGAVINLADLPTRKLNIRVLTPRSVEGVWLKFRVEDEGGRAIHSGFKRKGRLEHIRPYLVAGDDDTGPRPVPRIWTPPVGRYRITATPYLGSRRKPSLGKPVTVRFEVVNRP